MASILDKAGTNVGNAYKLISASPLDVRFTVADTEERDSIITANGCYPGLEVWVSSENKKYRAVPSGTSFVWKEIGTMEDIPDITFPDIAITDTGTKPIVGDVTADGHTITVSRIGLDDLGLASAYKYKGSVAAYANLPTTGNTEGDVYNVQTDGMNYAWTGSAWDALGGTVDLSNYVTLDGTQTITGNKTFTGNVVTSNNKFEIKANSNTDDSWIKLTNKSDSGYYAFGIRRPYDSYGLQLKIHGTDGADTYHDIWHAGNDGSGSTLDADLLDGKHASEFANYNEGIFYVEGTSATAGTWLGSNSRITEYYDGLIILYKINIAGASTTTLNINNLGAKTVYRYGSTKVTTHFAVNSIIVLSYMADLNSGCWMVLSSYDSTNVDQLRPSYARFYTADALYDYKICGIDKDGRLRPLTITEGTGTSKTVNTAAIRPNEFYYYSTTTNVAAGDIVAANYVYYVYSHTTFHYTFNSTGTTYCEIYLKGTLDSTTGLFTLDTTSATSWYTLVPYNTTITLSDYFVNGSYYILLGRTYSSNNYFTLFPNHPLYKFDGTNLKEIILEAVNADTLDGKHASEFLTAESDTLQTVTTRGATTDKAIEVAGLKSTGNISLYAASGGTPYLLFQRGTETDSYNDWGVMGTGGSLYFKNRGAGSAWGNRVTFLQDGGITLDAGNLNVASGSATANSFINRNSSNDYVLLGGGGTKLVSEIIEAGSAGVDLSSYVTGSGTANYIPKFTAAGAIGNSEIIDNGSNVYPSANLGNSLGHASYVWDKLFVRQIELNRSQGDTYGRINFYSPAFYTWYEYMSPNEVKSPTSKNTPQYGEVTSWARRSLIESNSGYGWIWEACQNSNTATPVGKMALSSNTGNLTVAGSVTANGFKHSDATTGNNNYVLLAGGGTKAIDDITGTTYGADRGISLSNGNFGHSNTAITAQATKGLYKISYDAYGHITGTDSFTLPTKDSWNYDDTYVKYSTAQTLTDTQKTQARDNIGAGTSNFSGNYNDLTNTPTIPTVNDATLTIKQGTTTLGTFTANAATNVSVDIPTPPNPTDYYWADVKVSNNPNTATIPSFQKVGVTGSDITTATAKVIMEYDSSYKALKFVFA